MQPSRGPKQSIGPWPWPIPNPNDATEVAMRQHARGQPMPRRPVLRRSMFLSDYV